MLVEAGNSSAILQLVEKGFFACILNKDSYLPYDLRAKRFKSPEILILGSPFRADEETEGFYLDEKHKEYFENFVTAYRCYNQFSHGELKIKLEDLSKDLGVLAGNNEVENELLEIVETSFNNDYEDESE